jgi:predicted anti-sigma-YlaC factor YlaD
MMHRIIRDHLEEVLTGHGSAPEHPAGKHLAECEECRDAVTEMRAQAAMLQQWRAPAEADMMEPRAGFYARVLERIEAQGPGSVWALFFDSLFARRIAMASLALALLLGAYVVSSEQMAEPQTASVQGLPQADFSGDVFSDSAQPRLVTGAPDQDAVLVNLVTYRER